MIAFVKGAPEELLDRCVAQHVKESLKPLDKAFVLSVAERMAAQGYRVLALACRQFTSMPANLAPEVVEDRLKFLELVGLVDPPRPEAFEAVATCKTAGTPP